MYNMNWKGRNQGTTQITHEVVEYLVIPTPRYIHI